MLRGFIGFGLQEASQEVSWSKKKIHWPVFFNSTAFWGPKVGDWYTFERIASVSLEGPFNVRPFEDIKNRIVFEEAKRGICACAESDLKPSSRI